MVKKCEKNINYRRWPGRVVVNCWRLPMYWNWYLPEKKEIDPI